MLIIIVDLQCHVFVTIQLVFESTSELKFLLSSTEVFINICINTQSHSHKQTHTVKINIKLFFHRGRATPVQYEIIYKHNEFYKR